MNRRRKQVLVGVGAATVLAVAGTTPGCPSDPRDKPDCPEVVVDVNSPPLPYWPNSTERTTFDATGESFTTTESAYAKLREESTPGGCWLGATFTDDGNPETTTWDSYHDRTTLYLSTPDSAVIGTRVVTAGDAFSTNGQNWWLDGVRVDFSGDDAIQSDLGRAGRVTDSLFDGVNVFMSSRGAVMDGTGNTVEVADTLVRSAPFENSYKCDQDPRYCGTHGGWFKWSSRAQDGIPPALWVHDSVFRADARGVHGGTTWTVNGQGVIAIQGLPPGSRCERVTLIVGEWADDPDYADRDIASWESQCSDLTILRGVEGIAEWDRLVAEWREEHP